MRAYDWADGIDDNLFCTDAFAHDFGEFFRFLFTVPVG